MLNVLMLCTANSARSILAEVILNDLGKNRFRAFSAGSHPRGTPHPVAIETLKARRHATGGLRSKSWEGFLEPSAPKMDIVITVCDAAAGEACPLWPGTPVKAHWGIPDPAGAKGGIGAERAAFMAAYELLRARMQALVALPVETMSREGLEAALAYIGAGDGTAPPVL